jgi:hypothetical protein
VRYDTAVKGIIMTEMNKLTLPCSRCGTELEEASMFEFGGTVACEGCVKSHYRYWPDGVIDIELRTRRAGAIAWLKRNRRTLEKRAAARVA